MPRISHNVPLAAYDHIANMLKAKAGPDGIVSRADAKELVADLNKAGRGTEALAAGNLFKMIDAQDNKDGARVTGFDLDVSRSFVENKMLENRDTNRNGYSQAEIAKMSPTARALVELGQTLAMEKAAGRVAHATPEAGLEHVAALLKVAAGKDGITSRDDLDALADDLYKQGRGTESLAAQKFFGFIDARDFKDGARVTGKDIDKAVAYAKESLLKNKDVNNNGYSQAEVAKFSTSAKAFLMVGQMIEAGLLDSAAA
jgi:hypothetical protein